MVGESEDDEAAGDAPAQVPQVEFYQMDHLDADEVERIISWLGRFLDHWPEHLIERLTEEASR